MCLWAGTIQWRKRVHFSPQNTKQHRGDGNTGSNYLCKFDWLLFGNVFCIFARKHSTVAAVHLLWDFLRRNKKSKCCWCETTEYKNVYVNEPFCSPQQCSSINKHLLGKIFASLSISSSASVRLRWNVDSCGSPFCLSSHIAKSRRQFFQQATFVKDNIFPLNVKKREFPCAEFTGHMTYMALFAV